MDGFDFMKSSYSSGEGGQRVEVATCPATVHVRDSKVPAGPRPAVSPEAWSRLVQDCQGSLS